VLKLKLKPARHCPFAFDGLTMQTVNRRCPFWTINKVAEIVILVGVITGLIVFGAVASQTVSCTGTYDYTIGGSTSVPIAGHQSDREAWTGGPCHSP
jgi:hypothetical protein